MALGLQEGEIVKAARSAPSTPSSEPRVDAATAKSLLQSLRLQPARDDELDKLYQFRQECGWGEERLKRTWRDPDWPLFVLVGTNTSGEEEEMGMGGLILEGYDGLASRQEGMIALSSLFVRHKYRGGGIGMRAFELLEQMAIKEYHAKALTLDTAAYHLYPSEDGTYDMEEVGVKSGNCLMYERRGYVIFGVSPVWRGADVQEAKRKYPNGAGELIYSINMKKVISSPSVANGHSNGRA